MISRRGLVLTGPFDIYGKKNDAGIYSNLGTSTLEAETGIFQLITTAGVYISATCAIVAAIMIIIGSTDKVKKLTEAKSFFIKIFIVSILFFGAGNIINLILGMGLD